MIMTYALADLVDFIEVLAVPGSGGLLRATTTTTAATAGPRTTGLRFLTGAKVQIKNQRREEKRRRDEM